MSNFAKIMQVFGFLNQNYEKKISAKFLLYYCETLNQVNFKVLAPSFYKSYRSSKSSFRLPKGMSVNGQRPPLIYKSWEIRGTLVVHV